MTISDDCISIRKVSFVVTLDQLIQHSLNALKECVQGDSVCFVVG